MSNSYVGNPHCCADECRHSGAAHLVRANGVVLHVILCDLCYFKLGGSREVLPAPTAEDSPHPGYRPPKELRKRPNLPVHRVLPSLEEALAMTPRSVGRTAERCRVMCDGHEDAVPHRCKLPMVHRGAHSWWSIGDHNIVSGHCDWAA